MTANDIIQLLDAAPFVPFRIHLTNGQTYDVPHRDFVWVERNRLLIAKPSPKSDRSMERVDFVSLLHVESVAPLERAA